MRGGWQLPTLEQVALELKRLPTVGRLTWVRGAEIRYCFEIAPSEFSPLYKCLLIVKRKPEPPSMFVISPDLVAIAGGNHPPHIYGYERGKTELCLWWPKMREWNRAMKFADTYIPWTAEWLWYYEYWKMTGNWEGGGAHPGDEKSLSG